MACNLSTMPTHYKLYTCIPQDAYLGTLYLNYVSKTASLQTENTSQQACHHSLGAAPHSGLCKSTPSQVTHPNVN